MNQSINELCVPKMAHSQLNNSNQSSSIFMSNLYYEHEQCSKHAALTSRVSNVLQSFCQQISLGTHLTCLSSRAHAWCLPSTNGRTVPRICPIGNNFYSSSVISLTISALLNSLTIMLSALDLVKSKCQKQFTYFL